MYSFTQLKKQIICLLFSYLFTVWMFGICVYATSADESTALTDWMQSESVVLMEASTGQIILQKNAEKEMSPASITKIMTLLLVYDELKSGKLKLTDEVTTSAYAKSMGGSQVFLEEGEVQTVETLIKCIVIASGNDASVAMAEKIAGSEEAFVERMNQKAKELGMNNTHFVDCCGLSSDDAHHVSAKDVAIMSKELITKYPEVLNYTKIWMEDIVHNVNGETKSFTLSSTNKLLKQYEYATGLKTGSTDKAKYCFAATGEKDGVSLIAVVMASPDPKTRFAEAKKLLVYGFDVCRLYKDMKKEKVAQIQVKGGVENLVGLFKKDEFVYLDTKGNDLNQIVKKVSALKEVVAPVKEGEKAGEIQYFLNGKQIGKCDIVYGNTVNKAGYGHYFLKVCKKMLL